MTSPTEDLALAISDELLASWTLSTPAVTVYAAPVSQVVPPCIVIRPDEPWISRARPGDLEGYLALGVVSTSSPGQAMSILHEMAHVVRRAMARLEGWAWIETGTVRVDETTGSPYLISPTRVSLRDCVGGPST